MMKRRRNVIGAQIRRLRYERRWSQDQLAAKLQVAGLNISRSGLAKIENGAQTVPEYQVYYFMNIFNVDYPELAPPNFNPHWRDFDKRLTVYLCSGEKGQRVYSGDEEVDVR